MKYHIFIGSTLDDLKNERRELPRIIMEMGHIPVMADYMDKTENTTSDAHQPGLLIQKTIQECDYFIALTAHKYCAPKSKTSMLEEEHAIAAKHGIPVLALIIDDKARWKASKKEKDAALQKKQDGFNSRTPRPC